MSFSIIIFIHVIVSCLCGVWFTAFSFLVPLTSCVIKLNTFLDESRQREWLFSVYVASTFCYELFFDTNNVWYFCAFLRRFCRPLLSHSPGWQVQKFATCNPRNFMSDFMKTRENGRGRDKEIVIFLTRLFPTHANPMILSLVLCEFLKRVNEEFLRIGDGWVFWKVLVAIEVLMRVQFQL